MNAQVASYYRSILFNDGQDQRPLPKGLLSVNMWATQRHQALGLGSTITKASALSVALTWLSSTKNGREFAESIPDLQGIFSEPEEAQEEPEATTETDAANVEPPVIWKSVKPETPVIVNDGGKSIEGVFVAQRGRWIDVKVNGIERAFSSTFVKLATAGA